FIAIYSKTHDIKLAALTAGAFASMKIMALEGNGIYSIATYGTREEFMAEHKDRFNEYLEKNDASGTVLFPVNH
ncbi:MAG TPA: hypothetical protein VLF68_01100, partial [Candidatus Saccharimonadales bacterium]|nr:hypothetical protein [Candidatus Saccharimonadales bacterium]